MPGGQVYTYEQFDPFGKRTSRELAGPIANGIPWISELVAPVCGAPPPYGWRKIRPLRGGHANHCRAKRKAVHLRGFGAQPSSRLAMANLHGRTAFLFDGDRHPREPPTVVAAYDVQ
jgi:hypothetical protein